MGVRIAWPDVDRVLFMVEKLGYVGASKQLGTDASTIRKFLRRMGQTPPNTRQNWRRLSLEPACRLAGSGKAVGKIVGVSEGLVSHWKAAGGIPEPMADKFACKLGLHPAEVWDDWWTEEELRQIRGEEDLRLSA